MDKDTAIKLTSVKELGRDYYHTILNKLVCNYRIFFRNFFKERKERCYFFEFNSLSYLAFKSKNNCPAIFFVK